MQAQVASLEKGTFGCLFPVKLVLGLIATVTSLEGRALRRQLGPVGFPPAWITTSPQLMALFLPLALPGLALSSCDTFCHVLMH